MDGNSETNISEKQRFGIIRLKQECADRSFRLQLMYGGVSRAPKKKYICFSPSAFSGCFLAKGLVVFGHAHLLGGSSQWM